MSLGELQRHFIASVSGTAAQESFDSRGMRVYANNYRGQLMTALRDTYAKTRLWLGDEAFDRAADRYIDEHLPSSWTLDAYGHDFPDMLEQDYPDDPDVSELAWLDGTLRQAFSGHDGAAIDAGALVADDWDRVEFVFVPTLRFRRLRSNAVAIWKALTDEIMPPAAVQTSAGDGVRVWRKDMSPRFTSMDASECACLDLALAGATFGEICERLRRLNASAAIAAEAGGLLGAWLGDGLVQSLRQG